MYLGLSFISWRTWWSSLGPTTCCDLATTRTCLASFRSYGYSKIRNIVMCLVHWSRYHIQYLCCSWPSTLITCTGWASTVVDGGAHVGLVMHRSVLMFWRNQNFSDIFWSNSEHDRIGKLILRICRSSEHYFFIHYLLKTPIYGRFFIKYVVLSWCWAS